MTLEEAAAMLDLPNAEDVADLLRAHGVKGEPGEACECPVSILAAQLTGRSVMTWPVGLGSRWLLGCTGEQVGLPSAAAAFADRYDDEDPAFADLVAS